MKDNSKMTIPLLDLKRFNNTIKQEITNTLERVVKEAQFIQGPDVTSFEEAIANYIGVSHAIGVSSGTDALLLALMALDIGPGDEVITTPFTFFATAGSIARVGAKPVFVDIDPETYNINPDLIEEKITPNTKAMMVVHLFGQMAEMPRIMEISKRHKLFMIEDAAQSIGAYFSKDGQKHAAGTVGDIGCFSFFPSKNLGAFGDGGLVTTNNEALAQKIKKLRVHGTEERYYHQMIGGNFRLDTIQAAILNIKLPYLDQQHQQRRVHAQIYNKNLNKNYIKPTVLEGYDMIYNQYTLRTKHRDALIKHLQNYTVGHAVYYPVPLHLQACFSHLGYKAGDFPVSEQYAKEVLSVPIFPELTQEELTYTCDVLNQFSK